MPLVFVSSTSVEAEGSPDDPSLAPSPPEIHGSSANDTLIGTSAHDRIYGNDGDDLLDGGADINWLFGGAGNDRLIANGEVPFEDMPGFAEIVPFDPGIYDGGSGFDLLVIPFAATTMSFYPIAFTQGQPFFTSVEGIYFQPPSTESPGQAPRTVAFSSTVAAEFPSDLLLDGVGNLRVDLSEFENFDASSFQFASGSDVQITIRANLHSGGSIVGSSQSDLLSGNRLHDNIFGGDGADSITGGDGNDHLFGRSAAGGLDGADAISGDAGADYLQGNAGNDTLDGGTGSDRINGGNNDDLITGGTGNDSINGNLGNDTISGGADGDSLRGGQDNDSIAGNDGDDLLSGDLGRDTLTGGAGRDAFAFSGQASPLASPDTITDFDSAQDSLIIGYGPAAYLIGSVQPNFALAAILAQQLFDGHAGNQEVARIAVGSDVYFFYSSDGGSTADSAILLEGDNITTSAAQDDAQPS